MMQTEQPASGQCGCCFCREKRDKQPAAKEHCCVTDICGRECLSHRHFEERPDEHGNCCVVCEESEHRPDCVCHENPPLLREVEKKISNYKKRQSHLSDWIATEEEIRELVELARGRNEQ